MAADEGSRLWLRRSAESVLRKAPCPVLTAKPLAGRKMIAEESKAEEEAGVTLGMTEDAAVRS
jgi:hypothetical protein